MANAIFDVDKKTLAQILGLGKIKLLQVVDDFDAGRLRFLIDVSGAPEPVDFKIPHGELTVTIQTCEHGAVTGKKTALYFNQNHEVVLTNTLKQEASTDA